MTGDVLKVESLCKTFGSLQVTDHVSLQLPPGRRQGVIGPNGAGKTTLFNLITGELALDSGQVYVGARDVSSQSTDTRARAGLARSYQRNNLFSELTVKENLTLACILKRNIGHVFWRSGRKFHEVNEEVEASAEWLGLLDYLSVSVARLSYGTQRHLEIGMALMQDPMVLLLDEPTAGMSPDETVAIVDLLASLPTSLTLLIIEHDMDVIFEIAEQITVLDYGRVLIEGSAEEIRGSKDVQSRYFGAPRP